MTPRQTIEIKQSERRERINALLGQTERSDDEGTELAKLTGEYQTGEVELRAAITVEPDETTTTTKPDETDEDRQLVELRSRVEFGDYITAALAGHGVMSGAALEYNQAREVPADRFPLDLLAPDAVETRAAVDGDAAATQAPWIERLFAGTAAARLGITMPSVPAGTRAYPVLGSTATPAQRGRTEAAVDAAITASVVEVKPTRSSVRAVYSVEDDARLPGLSDAILRDLRSAMTERIDRSIFTGDNGANENTADIVGLNTASITETTLTQSNKIKGVETVKAFADLVDGIYAGSFSDLNIVSAIGAWRLWESTVLPTPVTTGQTIASFMRAAGLSWGARGSIENATTAGKFAAFVGLGLSIEGAGVAPVWNSGQLIRDPYTGAAKGETALTLQFLWNFALPRPANFKRIKYVA